MVVVVIETSVAKVFSLYRPQRLSTFLYFIPNYINIHPVSFFYQLAVRVRSVAKHRENKLKI